MNSRKIGLVILTLCFLLLIVVTSVPIILPLFYFLFAAMLLQRRGPPRFCSSPSSGYSFGCPSRGPPQK